MTIRPLAAMFAPPLGSPNANFQSPMPSLIDLRIKLLTELDECEMSHLLLCRFTQSDAKCHITNRGDPRGAPFLDARNALRTSDVELYPITSGFQPARVL